MKGGRFFLWSFEGYSSRVMQPKAALLSSVIVTQMVAESRVRTPKLLWNYSETALKPSGNHGAWKQFQGTGLCNPIVASSITNSGAVGCKTLYNCSGTTREPPVEYEWIMKQRIHRWRHIDLAWRGWRAWESSLSVCGIKKKRYQSDLISRTYYLDKRLSTVYFPHKSLLIIMSVISKDDLRKEIDGGWHFLRTFLFWTERTMCPFIQICRFYRCPLISTFIFPCRNSWGSWSWHTFFKESSSAVGRKAQVWLNWQVIWQQYFCYYKPYRVAGFTEKRRLTNWSWRP